MRKKTFDQRQISAIDFLGRLEEKVSRFLQHLALGSTNVAETALPAAFSTDTP
jgi:hypothetical protein